MDKFKKMEALLEGKEDINTALSYLTVLWVSNKDFMEVIKGSELEHLLDKALEHLQDAKGYLEDNIDKFIINDN